MVRVVAIRELVDAAAGVEQRRVDALLERGRLSRPRVRIGLPRGDGRIAGPALSELPREIRRVAQRLVVDRVVRGHGARLATVVEVPVATIATGVGDEEAAHRVDERAVVRELVL